MPSPAPSQIVDHERRDAWYPTFWPTGDGPPRVLVLGGGMSGLRGLAALGARLAGAVLLDHGAGNAASASAGREHRAGASTVASRSTASTSGSAIRQCLPGHARVLCGAGPGPDRPFLPGPHLARRLPSDRRPRALRPRPRRLGAVGGQVLDQPAPARRAGRGRAAPSVAELLIRSAPLLRDFYASLEPARPRTPSSALALALAAAGPGVRVQVDRPDGAGGQRAAVAAGRQGGRRLGRSRRRPRSTARSLPSRPARRRRSAPTRAPAGSTTWSTSSGPCWLGWLRSGCAATATPTTPSIISTSAMAPGPRRPAVDAPVGDRAWPVPILVSHEQVDPSRPEVRRRVGVFLSSKLWFHYKGAIFWKLRAGMGEAVLAPLYQALVARGVLSGSSPRSGSGAVGGRRPYRVGPGRPASLARPRAATDMSRWRPSRGSPASRPGPTAAAHRRSIARPAKGTRRRCVCAEDFDELVFVIPPTMGRRVCQRLAAQRRDWRDMLGRHRQRRHPRLPGLVAARRAIPRPGAPGD